MDFILEIFIFIGIYIILGISLNLLLGYAGILSIAHASFYGIGAYAQALIALKLGTPFLFNMIIAIAVGAILGLLIGIPILRIKEDFFIIATFAFQVIVFSLLNNFVPFTGGPMGIRNIRQPNIFGFEIFTKIEFLSLTLMLTGFCFLICYMIIKSPFGRVLKSIREDEIFAQSLGKNVDAYKVKVFMICSGMATVAGSLHATYITYIDPSSFTVNESIFIISIVIIGGTGNLWGSVVGSTLLVTFPKLLTLFGLPNTIAANLREILYGLMLVLFLMFRPMGCIGEFSFYKSKKNE